MQTLRVATYKINKGSFIDVEMFTKQPMTADLSGLKVEYAIVLISSSESGKREVTLGFDVVGTEREVGRKFGKWLDVVVVELLLP